MIKIGYISIPVDNIDYVNEGDGTTYTTPYVMMKSGKKIEAEYGKELNALLLEMEENKNES